MKGRASPGLVAATVLLAACQMPSAQPATPAVLTNPGAEVRQELITTIQAMSGFASVALAASDLTRSSELVIERMPQSDNHGVLLQGREMQAPHRFQLQTQDGQCWLLHRASGQRQRLVQAQCRVVVSPQ